MHRKKKSGRSRDKGLFAIALFKWSKAVILILLGVGCLKLLHHDIEADVESLVNELRVDPDNRYVGALLAKLNFLDEKKIKALSGLTFAYSALYLVEGTGLYFEKRWAEYFTIVSTASFIPLEVYELVNSASVAKWGALIINVAIALFLVVKVRQTESS